MRHDGIVTDANGMIVSFFVFVELRKLLNFIPQLNGPLEALTSLLIPQSATEIDQVRKVQRISRPYRCQRHFVT